MLAGKDRKSGILGVCCGLILILLSALGGCAVVPANQPMAAYLPPMAVVAPFPMYRPYAPAYASVYVAPPVVIRPPVVVGIQGGWHRGWGLHHHHGEGGYPRGWYR